jgi:hypothetical protein
MDTEASLPFSQREGMGTHLRASGLSSDSAESLGHRFIRSIRLRERQHQLPVRHCDVVPRADRETALLEPQAAHALKRDAIVSASSR